MDRLDRLDAVIEEAEFSSVIVKLHKLLKFCEMDTLRFDMVVKVRLEVRPIVVDKEETEDCVIEKLLLTLEKRVE